VKLMCTIHGSRSKNKRIEMNNLAASREVSIDFCLSHR
jgi:hypothetical protein